MEGGTEKDGVWRKQSQEIREGQATADASAQTSVMTYRGGGGGVGERVTARPRAPTRKTEEAVDRRQNNQNVKACS